MTLKISIKVKAIVLREINAIFFFLYKLGGKNISFLRLLTDLFLSKIKCVAMFYNICFIEIGCIRVRRNHEKNK